MIEAAPDQRKRAENVNVVRWEKRLADLGFTVSRISSYPTGLDDVRQQLPREKRPFELSSLTQKSELGEALYAELSGYRIVMVPPEESTGFFAVNVYDPNGKLLMSNHDYSAPEFFDALRRNVPALEDKIPKNAAAPFQDLFST